MAVTRLRRPALPRLLLLQRHAGVEIPVGLAVVAAEDRGSFRGYAMLSM